MQTCSKRWEGDRFKLVLFTILQQRVNDVLNLCRIVPADNVDDVSAGQQAAWRHDELARLVIRRTHYREEPHNTHNTAGCMVQIVSKGRIIICKVMDEWLKGDAEEKSMKWVDESRWSCSYVPICEHSSWTVNPALSKIAFDTPEKLKEKRPINDSAVSQRGYMNHKTQTQIYCLIKLEMHDI